MHLCLKRKKHLIFCTILLTFSKIWGSRVPPVSLGALQWRSHGKGSWGAMAPQFNFPTKQGPTVSVSNNRDVAGTPEKIV